MEEETTKHIQLKKLSDTCIESTNLQAGRNYIVTVTCKYYEIDNEKDHVVCDSRKVITGAYFDIHFQDVMKYCYIYNEHAEMHGSTHKLGIAAVYMSPYVKGPPIAHIIAFLMLSIFIVVYFYCFNSKKYFQWG